MRRALIGGIVLGLTIAALAPLPASYAGIPDFTKDFAPDTIGPGGVTTATYTIVNTDATPETDLAFVDSLPAEITIATPANPSNTCDGTLVAPNGGSSITFSGGKLGASSSCTITVDVTSSTAGTHESTTGDLTSSAGNSGTATDMLTVDTARPGFTKVFSPTTVEFGERSTLTFTIDNTANGSDAFLLSFIDELPTGMTIADPDFASTDCDFGFTSPTLTADPGTATISLSGGAVDDGDTCTVSVDVVGGGVGALGNTSGELFSTPPALTPLNSSGKAAAILTVTPFTDLLEVLKKFTDDPVPPGGTVTLEFTVTNRSRDFAAEDITFDDDLETTLTGLTPVLPPTPDPPCGPLSSVTFAAGVLTLNDGMLGEEASCTFSVTLTVPATASPGSYPNTAGPVSGTIDGEAETGNTAGDILFVTSFPILTKEFLGDPLAVGATATLEFTITNPEDDSTMSSIRFIDELTDSSGAPGAPPGGFLPFPVFSATPTPTPDPPCGGGSSIAVVTVGFNGQGIELTGGSLAAAGSPGDSCTFTIPVDIPLALSPGTYTNTTRRPTAVLDDFAGPPTVTGKRAVDPMVVVVAAPQLTKEFTDDPVPPGGTVELVFTLENIDPDNAATAIGFSDDFGAWAPAGASATLTSVDGDDCGGTPSGVGTSVFTYSGGSLAGGATCTITVTLTVDGGASSGIFTNTTSDVSATVLGVPTGSPAAEDDIVVTGLLFTKEFTDDPVIPGDDVTLSFTLDNTAGAVMVDTISFTDDLTAVLPGTPDLTATPPPSPDPPCGPGSSLSVIGGSFLFFSGGEVAAGGSCTFTIPVTVPAGAAEDTYANVTSALSTSIGTLPPAADELIIQSTLLALSKEFTDDPVAPGDPVTLTFDLENLSDTKTVSSIAFTDDLGAALAGLTVTSVDLDTCGGTPGGVGTGVFSYSGGSLAALGTCTITLTLSVPAGPLPGDAFPNTTSAVSGDAGGFTVSGDPATDTLLVDVLEFTKAFDGPTTATGTAELTFTILNLDATAAKTQLAFSDDLDDVITGLTAVGPFPADPCGTGSTVGGGGFLTLTGGEVPAGGMCEFTVTVSVPMTASAGSFLNTTSALFSAGLPLADPATATLTIEPPPTFAKSFAPDPIFQDTNSTLTFTIDNSASALAAASLGFTDTLPAGVEVATPSVTANDCGGTLTATAGSGTISLAGGSVGAGDSCEITVVVTGTAPGTHTNTTGDLTSSSGNSGTAADTLTVLGPQADISVTKDDGVTEAVPGESVTYTIVVSNAGPSTDPAVSVTDSFPAELTCTWTSSASGGATGNTAAGAGDIADTLVMPAGSSVTYTADCDVDADATGTLSNTAAVSGSVTDPDPGNDSATDDDTLTPEADLAISKADDVDPAVAGTTVTYSFTVDNVGPSDATGVTVVDEAPPGMMFDSATVPCTPGVPAPGFLTCDLADIPAGGSSGVFDITFSIDPAAPPGTVTNEAIVSSDATDPDPSDNTATEDTEIVAEADLAISKTDDPDPAVAGDTVTYTFTVENFGPSDATGVTVIDDVPAGLMFDSAAVPCTPGVPGPGELTCDVGDIPAGFDAVFDVSFFIDPGAPPGTVTNGAEVSSDATEVDPSDNTTTEDTEIVAHVDLALFKVGDTPVAAGDTVTYSFSADNLGLSDATGVTVVDEAPPGMMFDSATVPCTPGVPAPGFVTCDLADIPAGGSSGVFDITFSIDPAAPPGTVTNEATVSSDGTELDPGDNTATADTEIVAEADLTITKVDTDDPVLAGESVTYEIVVENFGPSDATGVTVVDEVPAGLMFASADVPCTPGVPSPGFLTCDLGTLEAGFGITFEVTFDVDPAAEAGDVENEVTVSSDAADPVPGDNTATETTTIEVEADLDITKDDDPDPVTAGGTLTYTIEVFNFGPADATGVTVVDTLPAGVTYVSDTDACVEAPAGTLTCDLGAIPVFGTETFEITVTVASAATGSLTNTATVASDVTDPDTSDNTATETTSVVTSADLRIAKTDSPDPVRLGGTVTYTVTVTNDGPSDATGVVVTDTLPAGVVQARTSGCAEDDRGTPTCTLGTIAAGASKSYTITARVTGNTTRVLVNTASVSAATADPDTSDNSATAFTTVSRPQQPEVGLFDPVTARWTQLLRNGSSRTFTFGNPGDYGIVGDWDGDGDRTPGVLRTLNGDTAFFMRNSNSSGAADFFFVAGEPGDIPVAGDWNGNGTESLALYRPSTATWYVFFDFANVVPDAIFVFGNPGDDPSSVDVDGDGDSDPVAYRDMGALGGHVFIRRSLTTGPANGVFIYGNPADSILFGDYDYDGAATVGTYRPGDATFYLRNSNTSGVANLTIPLGIGRELPYAGPF